MLLGMSISILKVMCEITVSECHWKGQCGAATSELEFRCQLQFSFRRC